MTLDPKDIGARIEAHAALARAATPGRWHAYFTIHGDPSVVTDVKRQVTTCLAIVSVSPKDYGRANNLHIAANGPTRTLAACDAALVVLDLAVAGLAEAEKQAVRHRAVNLGDGSTGCWVCVRTACPDALAADAWRQRSLDLLAALARAYPGDTP